MLKQRKINLNVSYMRNASIIIYIVDKAKTGFLVYWCVDILAKLSRLH
jgi:hypothetical protein